MVATAPAPVGLALVVCDQIIEDKVTNKKSLIGIFNQIAASQFPCQHPQLAVFVSVSEGHGRYPARLRMIHEPTDATVVDVRGELDLTDVNTVAELGFDLRGVVFPQPGLYSIEFSCDDAIILERRFHVARVALPTPEPPPAAS